jgi:Ca2+-binding RTX toxin-like protein
MKKKWLVPFLCVAVLGLVALMPGVGNAAACSIAGTNGDDNLQGTPGNDKICGYNGHDTVAGFAGNDSVNAGYGDDHVNGGEGNDTLKGGPGDDTLQTDQDDDVDYLYGNGGYDRCIGGPEDVFDASCDVQIVRATV